MNRIYKAKTSFVYPRRFSMTGSNELFYHRAVSTNFVDQRNWAVGGGLEYSESK